MSDTNTATTGSTVSTIVIIFILLIVGVVIIYYILKEDLNQNFPINIFNADDKVVIRPAILSDLNNPNQYLCNDTNFRYYNYNTELAGYSYGGDNSGNPIAFAATFSGNPDQANSQWFLRANSLPTNSSPSYNSNQSITYGFGNRYFLQNAAFTENENEGRLRYQLLNENVDGFPYGMAYSTAPAVIGASGNENFNWFENELLLYFLPSKYKDLYYILLPKCTAFGTSNNVVQPNDAIVSVRPWSSNLPDLPGYRFTSNQKFSSLSDTCEQPANAGTYLPYIPPGQTTVPFGTTLLNQNVMILNVYDPTIQQSLDPNVFLFKITKV
jgi:hypothetical protein